MVVGGEKRAPGEKVLACAAPTRSYGNRRENRTRLPRPRVRRERFRSLEVVPALEPDELQVAARAARVAAVQRHRESFQPGPAADAVAEHASRRPQIMLQLQRAAFEPLRLRVQTIHRLHQERARVRRRREIHRRRARGRRLPGVDRPVRARFVVGAHRRA